MIINVWSMSNLVDNQLNKYIFLIASDLGDPPPSTTRSGLLTSYSVRSQCNSQYPNYGF